MNKVLGVALLSASLVYAQQPAWGQCGGLGWTGGTTCVSGYTCIKVNDWYSQCQPGTPATTAPTTTTSPASTAQPTYTQPAGTLPSSFRWNSTGVLLSPKNDGRNVDALKDPSIVYYEGKYHVFASTVSNGNYNLVHMSFSDFNQAQSSTFNYLDQSGIGTGYRAAPQVFYHAPHKLWYLVFQNGNAAYSTNADINNPRGWSTVKNFYSKQPDIITRNIGDGHWVDMWVICDSANCHLFSSDDNGHLYRSQTTLANFPNGFDSSTVIVMSDSNKYALWEAANVYKVDTGYLLLIEAIGSDGRRWFRSWTSSSIAGPWAALANTESNPFARANNVAFPGGAWTKDISHGEMIRTSVDQNMYLSPCKMRYMYQGQDPNAGGDYNKLPWRLALLTQTNSPC